MKITVICYYYEPENTAVSNYYKQLVEDFSRAGHTVSVITKYPTRALDQKIINHYRSKPVERISDRVTVYRVGEKNKEKYGIISRGFGMFKNMSSIIDTARKTETDAMLVASIPPFMGRYLKILQTIAPVTYNFQDVFPDNMVDAGTLKENGPIHRLLSRMVKNTYKGDSYIAISEDIKANVVSKGIDPEKVVVIPNWVDTEAIRKIPKQENRFFKELGLDRSKFYVSYCGNVGLFQDFDLLIRSAQELVDHPDIQFLIIGDGAKKEYVANKIEELNLTNITLCPMQDPDKASYVYSLGDVGLVTLKKNMAGSAMPSKTWTMMAAEQPIIATAERGSELDVMMDRAQAGIIIAPENSTELTNAIVELYSDSDSRTRLSENGRKYVLETLRREIVTSRYLEVLENNAAASFA